MAKIKGAKEIELDQKLAARYRYRQLIIEQIGALKAELDLVDQELKDAIGDHEVATIGGRQVIDYRRQGQFQVKRFTEDNPHIVAAYSQEVTELKFDVDRFKEHNPALYEAYRVRAFRPITPTKGD